MVNYDSDEESSARVHHQAAIKRPNNHKTEATHALGVRVSRRRQQEKGSEARGERQHLFTLPRLTYVCDNVFIK